MAHPLAAPFVPPPYPYDRLAHLHAAAKEAHGEVIDLSIGTPCDAPPAAVVTALATSGTERGYPTSVGSAAFRQAAVGWMDRRLSCTVDPAAEIAACVGTKEFVAGLPHLLRLRRPDLDTVLHPAVSYPSYAMGAILGGCRAVAVPCDDRWRLDLDAIDPSDIARALCLWSNTPGNPAGGLDDLDAIAAWGRRHGVPVFSDECYVEFTWDGPRRTILAGGTDGVVAVHSLSKRSNLAGVRVGCYAGDADLVHYLSEVRKHLGLIVAGPAQAAAVVAWSDDLHVDEQRARYLGRLRRLAAALSDNGIPATVPGGAFYLWVAAPGGDAWALAEDLAVRTGAVVSPGEFYGELGSGHVRIAAVQPDERIDQFVDRLSR